jgi:hypothetical protein
VTLTLIDDQIQFLDPIASFHKSFVLRPIWRNVSRGQHENDSTQWNPLTSFRCRLAVRANTNSLTQLSNTLPHPSTMICSDLTIRWLSHSHSQTGATRRQTALRSSRFTSQTLSHESRNQTGNRRHLRVSHSGSQSVHV